MKQIWTIKNMTLGQLLVAFVFVALSAQPLVGFAKDKQEPTLSVDMTEILKRNPEMFKQMYAQCIENKKSEGRSNAEATKFCNNQFYPDPNNITCRERIESAKEAEKRINESCAKAGFGRSCLTEIFNCEEALESAPEDYRFVDNILQTATGLPIHRDEQKSRCPQMSGKDYFTEQKRINEKMEDHEEKLADLEKEKAKIEKEFNEDMQETQEKIREAQKDLEDNKLKINEEKREQISQFGERQSQMNDQIRKLNAEMITRRGEAIALDRRLATELIAISDTSIQSICMQAVRKMRDETEKAVGPANTFARARQRKTLLIEEFDKCMASMRQKRLETHETHRQKTEETENRIANIQSEIDDMENQMKTSSTQLAEMEADAKKKVQTAEQNLYQQMNEAQMKMKASQANTQKQLQALAQQQMSLRGRITKLSNELAALGPVPSTRSTEAAPKAVMADVESSIATINDLCSDTSCPGSTNLCAKYNPPEQKSKSTKDKLKSIFKQKGAK